MTENQRVETRKITQKEAEQCASEALQHIGAIQPHGFSLTFDTQTLRLVQFSDNIAMHIPVFADDSPVEPESLLGSPVSEWINVPQEVLEHELFASAMQTIPFTEGGAISPHAWECMGVRRGNYILLEFFPTSAAVNSSTILTQLDKMVSKIRQASSVAALYQSLTDEFQQHTGYDRVMLYRFLPDWSGEVVSESVSGQAKVQFLGMRFPAEDIPKQAREIYKTASLRIIADTEGVPSALVPKTLPDGALLDQSVSVLRSASTMHVAYLRNLGVRASMSIALMSKGELWGLLAFHHYSPKIPPNHIISEMKASCELFAEIVISHLHPTLDLENIKRVVAHRQIIESVFNNAKRNNGALSLVGKLIASLQQQLGVDCVGIILGEDCYAYSEEGAEGLDTHFPQAVRALFTDTSCLAFESHSLGEDAPDVFKAMGERYCGLIAMPSKLVSDLVVFLAAKEVIKHIDWGGQPETVDIVIRNGERHLEPRSSFALWRQKVEGQSDAWLDEDRQMLTTVLTSAEEYILHCRNEDLKKKLYQKSYSDPLTGLPNRSYLEEFILSLERAEKNALFTVFYIDLDNFKRVNDYIGHLAGDKLLVEVAKRLRACVRPNDLVARLGGDEFVVVIRFNEDLPSSAEGASRRIADKILSIVGLPVLEQGIPMVTSPSIGALICKAGSVSYQDILRKSDIAMYRAKHSGKNRVHFFSEEDEKDVIQEGLLEAELRIALQNQTFSLVYQPQTDCNGNIISCEVLARWHHPTLGDIPPDIFIPLAEKHNLIGELGKLTYDMAMKQMSEWIQSPEGRALKTMSINVSPAQLLQKDFCDVLCETAKKHDLDPRYIRLEITETLIMQHFDESVSALSMLREKGFSVSLDDFGTGYSSLGYLWKLPIDEVKIDRLFITNIRQDETSLTLVEGIIDLCHKLQLTVVAEGVEEKYQATMLRGFGCDVFQGYYFGRPVHSDLFFQKDDDRC